MGATEMELFGFKKLDADKIGQPLAIWFFFTNQIRIRLKSINRESLSQFVIK